jgi:hypothetical protein
MFVPLQGNLLTTDTRIAVSPDDRVIYLSMESLSDGFDGIAAREATLLRPGPRFPAWSADGTGCP